MDDTLTLFYLKKSGAVKCFCSGKQTLDYYGSEKEDIEEIMDFIYVKFDDFLITNFKNYIVKDGKVEFIQPKEIEIIK